MNSAMRSNQSLKALRVSAPAKINLHLEVLGLRADGFHELAMVMQSIELVDHLEFVESDDGQLILTCDVPSLDVGEENLILKAGNLLRSRLKLKNLGASIHLEKSIPIGAGLAGGSSDCAATLLGLNRLWNLGLSAKDLEQLAAELGSDVPFCLCGGTKLCFGRGELFESLPDPISSIAVLLVKDPLESVSTPWAFSKCKEIFGNSYLKLEADFEKRRQFLRNEPWLQSIGTNELPELRNDLQQVVYQQNDSVKKTLNLLSTLPGKLAFSMSGSGPSCFALFRDLASAYDAQSQCIELFRDAGLQSWCCSFRTNGARVEA